MTAAPLNGLHHRHFSDVSAGILPCGSRARGNIAETFESEAGRAATGLGAVAKEQTTMVTSATTTWLTLALLFLPGVASAAPDKPQPPARIRTVPLAAGGRCPPSTADEIVVCQTLDEPYRIPKSLRRTEIAAANQSWVNRAATLDDLGRVSAGLPDTCSVVGTGGQTGCALAAMHAWAAERRAAQRLAQTIP